MWSGLPLGTIPPEVHSATVAWERSFTAGLGATRSKEGIGYSVVNGLSASFLRSMSTARLEPRSFSKKFTRTPLGM